MCHPLVMLLDLRSLAKNRERFFTSEALAAGILLDVRMPLLSGTEFAEGLKKEHPNVKIILISAFADETLQKTAHNLGVMLLSKPFTPDRLLTLTGEVLGQPA
jgi:CheY-like chemotaxis protein